MVEPGAGQVAGLAAHIDALKAARKRLGQGSEAVASLRRIAHALRGSGATYGYPEVRDAAAALEGAGAAEVAASLERLLGLLAELQASLAPSLRQHLLLVEENAQMARLLTSLLDQPDRQLHVAAGARAALEALDAQPVSLVVLDLGLSDTDGRNLLMHLRERPATASLPVIVLSSLAGSQPKTECFALGADAYFEKPVAPEVLRAAVSSKLQRAARAAAESRLDELTGLPNRVAFCEGFLRMGSLSRRKREGLALALVDFDRFREANDRFGRAIGDELLKRGARIVSRHLRRSDLMARWGGDKFAVLFPDTYVAGAATAMAKALGKLREEPFRVAEDQRIQLSFSAGVAAVAEGAAVEEALADADHLLLLAKGRGRACVQTQAEPPPAAARKILLLEPDEMQAMLIKSKLGRAGLEILAYPGPEAPANPDISLVIADASQDPAGMASGLARWRARSRSAPLLIIARASDQAAWEGLRALGPDDMLARPFSPFELVARVHRLLRRGV